MISNKQEFEKKFSQTFGTGYDLTRSTISFGLGLVFTASENGFWRGLWPLTGKSLVGMFKTYHDQSMFVWFPDDEHMTLCATRAGCEPKSRTFRIDPDERQNVKTYLAWYYNAWL